MIFSKYTTFATVLVLLNSCSKTLDEVDYTLELAVLDTSPSTVNFEMSFVNTSLSEICFTYGQALFPNIKRFHDRAVIVDLREGDSALMPGNPMDPKFDYRTTLAKVMPNETYKFKARVFRDDLLLSVDPNEKYKPSVFDELVGYVKITPASCSFSQNYFSETILVISKPFKFLSR